MEDDAGAEDGPNHGGQTPEGFHSMNLRIGSRAIGASGLSSFAVQLH
jgi:hypothetical protein